MDTLRRGCWFTAVVVLLAAAPAWAQATAQLAGTVRDESGAVLPGVSVSLIQIDTGFTRSVATEANGDYVMSNLPTGPYRLEISLQGFRTYVQTGIVLQVGATPTINAVLQVGNLEQTVSVEAAAPLVDIRSSGISEVVEQKRILELPSSGTKRHRSDRPRRRGRAVGAECEEHARLGVHGRCRRPSLRRCVPARWRHAQQSL